MPVAWVSESQQYVQLLEQKLTTHWDVVWCGANGDKCRAGAPDSANVHALIGKYANIAEFPDWNRGENVTVSPIFA